MAKGSKELKLRIKGVKNIQQITRAMEMVATQKLKRLQTRADAARPFADKIQEMVARLAGSVRPDLSPLLQARPVQTTVNLVVSSDKGLCGGYNVNLVRHVQEILGADASRQRLVVLGRKGQILLRARKREIEPLPDLVEKLDSGRVRTIVREFVADFLAGRVDQLRLVYTAFLSSTRQRAMSTTISPIRAEDLTASGPAAGPGPEFIVEPDPEGLLRTLLPKFLEIKAYSAVLQALASEFTARRNAMKQATDAADDMIHALRRQYNRARQESITSELLEVSSGAEALK